MDSYIHLGGKIGVLLEVGCESANVAQNEEFKVFAHDVAMQIAAANPLYLVPDEVPGDVIDKEKEDTARSGLERRQAGENYR